MKKKVLSIILVLAIAVGIIALRPSLGWLSPGDGGGKSQQMDIGKFKYNFEGSLHAAYIDESSTEYAAPGENLIYDNGVSGSLKAYNFSSIPTNLRVRIDYTYYDTSTSSFTTVAYSPSSNDFDVTFNNTADTTWCYNGDKCWDLKAAGAVGDSDPPYSIPAYIDPATLTTEETSNEATTVQATGDLITIITHLGYSKDLAAGNPYELQNVTVKITVEAKQADYADWTTIYSTYYPGG